MRLQDILENEFDNTGYESDEVRCEQITVRIKFLYKEHKRLTELKKRTIDTFKQWCLNTLGKDMTTYINGSSANRMGPEFHTPEGQEVNKTIDKIEARIFNIMLLKNQLSKLRKELRGEE